MKTAVCRATALLLLCFLTLPVHAEIDVRFPDLAGWWSAQPEHGGDRAHMALQFVEKDGKQLARLSAPALGVYDFALGEVKLTGRSLDTTGLSFPLTWNDETRTLSGFVPADIAPVYRIPIEFRRGEPLEKPPAKEWTGPRPKLLWSVDTGAAVWAGIERDAAGTLYVGNESGELRAIDAQGNIRWTVATGKAIRAQPTVIGPHVLVASDSGYLHQLDRKSGKEIWRARIDSGAPARIPTDGKGTRWDRYGSSVVAAGQRLFIASRDKNLYALDRKTGRELWRVAAGDLMTATPAIFRDLVIFAAYDGKVQAVNVKDGAPRWTYDAKLAVTGDVIVAGDRVVIGSRSYDLIALDASTGKELWKHYYWFSWVESPPVVRDGVVYTGSSDATHVYAIDLADGKRRWKTAVPGWSWQRAAVGANTLVAGTAGAGAYPGSRAGSLVSLDRESGAIRWIHLEPPTEEVAKSGASWGFGSSPVLVDGVVYAADLGGRVYAFGE
jgi:outer membrane protein assembly factor BamB